MIWERLGESNKGGKQQWFEGAEFWDLELSFVIDSPFIQRFQLYNSMKKSKPLNKKDQLLM
jgi:hypothetical protein